MNLETGRAHFRAIHACVRCGCVDALVYIRAPNSRQKRSDLLFHDEQSVARNPLVEVQKRHVQGFSVVCDNGLSYDGFREASVLQVRSSQRLDDVSDWRSVVMIEHANFDV